MEWQWGMQILVVAFCVWIALAIANDVCIYLKRRKVRHDCRTVKELDMISINYTTNPNIVQKHIDQLNPGDVFMNSKHDPLNPRTGAGLYMAVRKGQDIYCVSFKGTALTYEQLKSSTAPQGNMVWIFDVEVFAAAKRK